RAKDVTVTIAGAAGQGESGRRRAGKVSVHAPRSLRRRGGLIAGIPAGSRGRQAYGSPSSPVKAGQRPGAPHKRVRALPPGPSGITFGRSLFEQDVLVGFFPRLKRFLDLRR